MLDCDYAGVDRYCYQLQLSDAAQILGKIKVEFQTKLTFREKIKMEFQEANLTPSQASPAPPSATSRA